MPRPISPAIRRLLDGAHTTSVGGTLQNDPYEGDRGPARYRYEELRLDAPDSPALDRYRADARTEAAAKGETLSEDDPLEPEQDGDADDMRRDIPLEDEVSLPGGGVASIDSLRARGALTPDLIRKARPSVTAVLEADRAAGREPVRRGAAPGTVGRELEPGEVDLTIEPDARSVPDDAIRERYRRLVDDDFRRSTDGMVDAVLDDFDRNQRARAMTSAYGAAMDARRPAFTPDMARADRARIEREVAASRPSPTYAKSPKRLGR